MKQNENNQLDAMLELTAKKLGTTPDQLKKAAENGRLADLLSSGGEAQQMKQVLNDQKAIKRLLNSPQAKKLMELINQKNGNP